MFLADGRMDNAPYQEERPHEKCRLEAACHFPLHSLLSSPRLKVLYYRGGIPMRINITSQTAMSCWSAARGYFLSILSCSLKH